MRYELSDYEWRVIGPMLPNKPRGKPRVDDRRILNGIIWVLSSGAPWRDLPTPRKRIVVSLSLETGPRMDSTSLNPASIVTSNKAS